MAKTTEEIFREAKEKNKRLASTSKSDSSESWKDDYYMTLTETEPPTFSSSTNSSPKFSNNKWYEKNWGVALALIVCFPVGLILLWQNPRYTNQIKGIITVAILFLILYNPLAADKPVSHNTKSVYTQSNSFMSYQGSNGDTGYLKQGAEWLDGNGDFHYNSRKVKVEIGKQKIVASDGKLTQIYFLEGKYSGIWGYTRENCLSK